MTTPELLVIVCACATFLLGLIGLGVCVAVVLRQLLHQNTEAHDALMGMALATDEYTRSRMALMFANAKALSNRIPGSSGLPTGPRMDTTPDAYAPRPPQPPKGLRLTGGMLPAAPPPMPAAQQDNH